MTAVRAAVQAAAIAAVAAVTLGACGGEAEFDAPGFVELANEAGAGMELREELLSTGVDVEVWAVSFPEDGSGAAPTGASEELDHEGEAHAHGTAGSLAVAADADTARGEFERCEASATLVCFRAANVVLRLEGATAEETNRLGEVFRSLESG